MALGICLFALVFFPCFYGAPPVCAEDTPAGLAATSVFLEITAEQVDNGKLVRFHGSGVVVTENGFVLTSTHNLLDRSLPGKFKNVEVTGRIGSRAGIPQSLDVIHVGTDADVAVLKFKEPLAGFVFEAAPIRSESPLS